MRDCMGQIITRPNNVELGNVNNGCLDFKIQKEGPMIKWLHPSQSVMDIDLFPAPFPFRVAALPLSASSGL